VKANVSATAFSIKAGRTNEIKVAVKRLHGFQPELRVSMRGLPDGLAAEPATVPEKGGDVSIKLVASAEAEPCSGPIQIVVTETESRKEHLAMADLTSSTVNNGVPGGFTSLVIEATDQLWLTVLPATDAKK
jgi:ferritin-like protein